MRVVRRLASLLLAVAILLSVALAALGGLRLAGVDVPLARALPVIQDIPLNRDIADGTPVRVPPVPASRPDNPRPPRQLAKMSPDQFDPITRRKDMAGTRLATIVVYGDRVELMIGDRVTWTGPFRTLPGFDGRISIADVAGLVARGPAPEWLRQSSPGVFQLQAGLLQAPGTTVEYAAPELTELRMVSAPYVYVCGVGANATFKGVHVTSLVPGGNGPDKDPGHRRPFVCFDEGGRFDVIESEFSYLGTDASKAYGVSWGTATTGEASRSVFHHNLFGAYTSRAVGVTFRFNTFRDNAIYGLDPHTQSQGLVATDNEAYGNNSHGIIFSENVHHSIVERNRSHHNGGNGIMMDEKSDDNVIRRNEVWDNRGDGIVLQGSSRTLVTENRITGNEVAVRVNANELGPADANQVVSNELADNLQGIQVYGAARGTVSRDNQIRGTGDQALSFSEPATSQSDTVVGARKALVVTGVDATVRGLAVSDVETGVEMVGASRTTIQGSQVSARDIALRVDEAAQLTLTSDGDPTVISGARKGLYVAGTADVRDVRFQGVDRGVLVTPGGRATISGTAINATNKGLEIEGWDGQERVQLSATDVRAPEPVVGATTTMWQWAGNSLKAVPSWLAIAGAVFIVVALALHFGHRLLSPQSSVRHRGRYAELSAAARPTPLMLTAGPGPATAAASADGTSDQVRSDTVAPLESGQTSDTATPTEATSADADTAADADEESIAGTPTDTATPEVDEKADAADPTDELSPAPAAVNGANGPNGSPVNGQVARPRKAGQAEARDEAGGEADEAEVGPRGGEDSTDDGRDDEDPGDRDEAAKGTPLPVGRGPAADA